MLRSIGKQSGEFVESVLKKKRKAAVGRICRKERFCVVGFAVRGFGLNLQLPTRRRQHCLVASDGRCELGFTVGGFAYRRTRWSSDDLYDATKLSAVAVDELAARHP